MINTARKRDWSYIARTLLEQEQKKKKVLSSQLSRRTRAETLAHATQATSTQKFKLI